MRFLLIAGSFVSGYHVQSTHTFSQTVSNTVKRLVWRSGVAEPKPYQVFGKHSYALRYRPALRPVLTASGRRRSYAPVGGDLLFYNGLTPICRSALGSPLGSYMELKPTLAIAACISSIVKSPNSCHSAKCSTPCGVATR